MNPGNPLAWTLRMLKTWVASAPGLFLLFLGCGFSERAQGQNRIEAPSQGVEVIAVQGVQWWIAPKGAADWVLASTQMPQTVRPGDRIRTGRQTRLFMRTPRLGVIQVAPLSTLEISPFNSESEPLRVRILNGMLYLFHRGSPLDVEVHSRTASAAVRGTEFVAEAREDGGLDIRMIDGSVELKNDIASVVLTRGEEGSAATGSRPQQSPALYSQRALQWCLYYPAIVDPEDIGLNPSEQEALKDSLSAYRAGDLIGALSAYPEARVPQSNEERVYRAALWLSLGQVSESERLLGSLGIEAGSTADGERAARALRRLIAVVRTEPLKTSAGAPVLSSEWMAESYVQQSEGHLAEALASARHAAQHSQQFGAAWVRLAELEFGFGHNPEAERALKMALSVSPRHAMAHTLQGFQFCARNDVERAIEAFKRALALDPGHGNAWLGRGLCEIRQGKIREGLSDLEAAAAVEPQRALFRSYLGKVFASSGDLAKARAELQHAKELDPGDPTAWLYSALLDQESGRINSGIRHLQRSKELNQNRALYRSRHLLEQDQAVRGANLSTLYRDAGFPDLARREAVDAVNTDYANASAHLFLANSYNELRDPGRVDLRYETPWFNEYLLANLLAPAGAGVLSQTVSSQEFSRLFQHDGVGLVSLTEYASRGDWLESAAHYGLLGNLAFSLEADYRSSAGQRPNADQEQRTFSAAFKQQLSPQDSIYFQSVLSDTKGGDTARVYDPTDPAFSHPGYRFTEKQEPLLLAGYHHQWSPGQDTLLLAGRLQDNLESTDSAQPVLLVSKDPGGAVTGTVLTSVDQRYRSELEICSVELQHIAQWEPWTLIVGSRAQWGEFDTASIQQNLADQAPALPVPLNQHVAPGFERLSAYAYGQWHALDSLRLFGGGSFDHLRSPSNYRFAPLLDNEETRDQWSPKGGAVWKISPSSTLSGAYTRSVGGVSLDQSYRLEPSQVPGFNQSWRGLIPESAVGSQAASRMDMASLQWDQRFRTETYLAVRGDLGRSGLTRQVGVFDLPFLAEASTTPEQLRFREETLTAHLHQLLGNNLSLGTQYRLSRARLEDDYLNIPASAAHFFPPYELKPQQELTSTLHQVQLFTMLNHPSGFFGRAEALWSLQSNAGYSPDRPGDDFWQFNLFAGYRFHRRRAEIRLGLLNLTDQDYRLNPLNLTPELPRHRTLTASLRLSF